MLDLTKERILVTGGNGFLGQHVVQKLLGKRCTVYAPASDELDLYFEQAALDEIDTFDPSLIIHLAAVCGGIGRNQEDPVGMVAVNTAMALNVVKAATRNDAKLVTVGSVCSYPANCPVPFREENLFDGAPDASNLPYGMAKRMLGTLLDAYHRQYGLKCAYLIPANLYGPGDHFEGDGGHVIPMMIRKFVEDSEGGDEPRLWGTGWATRDFLYVEDCADAIIRAAEVIDDPSPINIGTGEEWYIREVANIVSMAVSGNAVGCHWDHSKPDGQKERCLDVTRAKQLLGWSATTDLYEGIEKTVAWYKANRPVAA